MNGIHVPTAKRDVEVRHRAGLSIHLWHGVESSESSTYEGEDNNEKVNF